MEWSRESVLHLIELYRMRTVLWDSSLASYRDRNERHGALTEIAVVLGTDKDSIEKKIKNLQSHFGRELKKENAVHSDLAGDGVYKSKWFCFKSLMFLANKNKPRGIEDAEVEVTSQNEEVDEESDQSSTQCYFDDPMADGVPKGDEYTGAQKKRVLSSQKCDISARKRKRDYSGINDAYAIMAEIYKSRCNRDEYTVFGEQVAMKLRKLPTEHSKLIVQHIINTTLFEAQLGKYNNSDTDNRFSATASSWAHFNSRSEQSFTSTHSQLLSPTYPRHLSPGVTINRLGNSPIRSTKHSQKATPPYIIPHSPGESSIISFVTDEDEQVT